MITDFLINGEFKHFTEKTYNVTRPRDGSVLATLPSAGKEDVHAAVEAAKAAYHGGWQLSDPAERQSLMLKWADLVEERADEIAALVSEDVGADAAGWKGECTYVAGMLRFYAGLAVLNYGDVLSMGDDHVNYVVKVPHGVCGIMPPWNSPLQSPIQKMGPALAAGNTVVLRAPEEAPMGAMQLVKAAHDVGFPKGVVNVIVGEGLESGTALVEHSDVKLVSFTGSAPTGKAIATACARQMKRYVMELGGKSPVIVFEDGNLDKALEESVAFAFAFQGQICCANTRILIQRSIFESFKERLVELVGGYRSSIEGSDKPVGPLFNRKVFDRTTEFTEIARKDGTILCGGSPIELDKGFYFQPTVVEFEDDSSIVCKEEIFGPVLSLIPFDDEEDAIAIANNVDYGLASTVYSEDRQRIFRVVRRLEAGTVWANAGFKFNIHMPWGGPKDTGINREFGKYALDPYFEEKNIWLC
jgi:aminomuconate-semialdehyde/2-hydroxymuconate-6-semialdehyde dehydrogenase